MSADLPGVKPKSASMGERVGRLRLSAARQSSRDTDKIDMKHRRWIDQVLAESHEDSVTLPWARAPKTEPAEAARKIPQDIS